MILNLVRFKILLKGYVVWIDLLVYLKKKRGELVWKVYEFRKLGRKIRICEIKDDVILEYCLRDGKEWFVYKVFV